MRTTDLSLLLFLLLLLLLFDAPKLQVALLRPALGSNVSPTCRALYFFSCVCGGGGSSGGAGNPLFSRGAFSLCLSGCLLLCCDSSDLDFTAPGGAVTNKGLPGGDLNVEAFRGYSQGVHEAFRQDTTFAVERTVRLSIKCN